MGINNLWHPCPIGKYILPKMHPFPLEIIAHITHHVQMRLPILMALGCLSCSMTMIHLYQGFSSRTEEGGGKGIP